MAMYGYRPVVELQFDGFSYPAFEQITSHLAKMPNRSRGTVRLPVVVRIPFGGGIGAVEHHSESPEALYAHTAGLKIVTPSTPSDAYALLRASIASPDPVLFFEPKRRYWTKEDVELPVTTEPPDTAVVRRPGSTATLISYGPTVATCLEAAEAATEDGWELEVIDLRSLAPIDIDTLLAAVERTGRVIVVHEASVFAGLGAEIAAELLEQAFWSLEAPVLRVGGFDIPYPASQLEHYHLPDVDRILDAVERSLDY
jgi:pyruvate dehydrogenase E1 component beta subunit